MTVIVYLLTHPVEFCASDALLIVVSLAIFACTLRPRRNGDAQ